MNNIERFNDLIQNPEKYLFGYKDMDEHKQKKYSEGFYSEHPKPKDEYDEYGLRYDIDYLNKLGNDIVLCPVEFMANYVDAVTKSLIDANDEEFIEAIMFDMSDVMLKEQDYQNMNATAFGNMAYVYLHTKNETAKRVVSEALKDIFIWKSKQYKAIIETLNTIN